ncbi:Ras suppressor protein 1-like protein, partial [Dinothrombium tinctorium]
MTLTCLPSSDGSVANKMPLKQRSADENPNEIDLCDKGIAHLDDINKFAIPPSIANLSNLEILNLFNNQIEELPTSLSSMTKLKILNVGMNRLYTLPRGFGAFPALEVLDLTYNNLNDKSLPGNFFMMETLRALYLGDNDFEYVSAEIGQLKNLQILVFRDNDLIMLPKEIGQLSRLRELHIQNNRLTVLPPELGNLDLCSHRSVVRMEGNPWVPPIADQLQIGVSHVIEYIRSDTYK